MQKVLWHLLSRPIINWLNHQEPTREFPLSDFDSIRHEIRPCDVVLVEGRSRVGNIIKAITQSPWSHGALYLGRLHDIEDPLVRQTIKRFYDGQPNEQLIIESELGMGTVIRPLSVYGSDHLRICRPKELSYKDSQQVIRYAVSRLGTEYDVRQIFDLLRFLLPWSFLPKRLASSLFKHHAGRSTKLVCSTMIAEAFAYVQYPILPLIKRNEGGRVQYFRRNPRLFVPSDFDYSPYFNIIKYPFMQFNDQSRYRLLPWDGDIRLTGPEANEYIDPSSSPVAHHELEPGMHPAEVESRLIEKQKAKPGNSDNGSPLH